MLRVLVSVSIAFFMLGALTACEGKDGWTVGKVQAFVRENLPIGSGRSRVVQLLGEKGIENSGPQAASGVLYAIIRNTSGGPIIKGSITMKFYFDDSDRLVRYEIQKVFTGL
jgi:hypothetical protein